MPFEFYKIVHLLGLFMLFFGFGGVHLLAYTGGDFSSKKKLLAFISHGIGLFLILVSGFGMAARLGYFGDFPKWIYFKIAIWVYFGIMIAILKRRGHLGWTLLVALLAVGTFAAYLGVYKPF